MSVPTESGPPLLECAPEEGARRLALRWIDEATRAAERLIAGGDDEALHDMRVALRKLRTVMRTYDDALRSSLKKKRTRRLKDLVQATGVARDSEVQIAWLSEARDAAGESARVGIEWLVDRLRDRNEKAYVRLRTATVPALLELLPKLRRDLARYEVEHVVFEARPPRRFADETAALLRAQGEELRAELHAVASVEDEKRAHEARKESKRLRYLLEPLRDEAVPGAKELVKTLKRLQDLLGELNDAAVRTKLLREEIESAALERARTLADEALSGQGGERARRAIEGDEEPGLLAQVRATHERRMELYAELEARWIPAEGMLDELIDAVESFADGLSEERASAVTATEERAEEEGAPAREIERKYLLSALPDQVREHVAIEIDQGYVPGEELHERLRRTKKDGVERFYRTIKLGQGLSRIEIEEETTREIFARMWPLTKGRRVRKRRWKIPEGERTWEIDEFLDRELALAEVELPSEDAQAPIPPWLEPCVVREVTDEPTYVNLNLAR